MRGSHYGVLIASVALALFGFAGLVLCWWYRGECANFVNEIVVGESSFLIGYAIYLIYKTIQRREEYSAWDFGPMDLVFAFVFGLMNGFLTYEMIQSSTTVCAKNLYYYSYILLTLIWIEVGFAFAYVSFYKWCIPATKELLAHK
jgi:hypothetical protein